MIMIIPPAIKVIECTGVLGIVNILRPRQNGRHFTEDISKCILMNENIWISIKISLEFVSKDPNDNIPALVQIMVWHRTGDKPLSEPMVALFTDIYIHHSASMALRRCGSNPKLLIFKLKSRTNILSISCEIALRWRLQDHTDDLSTLFRVMAWCCQSWPRSVLPQMASLGHYYMSYPEMPHSTIDRPRSTLVQVMACPCLALSH